jgi:hypothetical protein
VPLPIITKTQSSRPLSWSIVATWRKGKWLTKLHHKN